LRINSLTKTPHLQMTHTRIAPRFRPSFSAKAPRIQGIFGRLAALALGFSAFATGSLAQDYTYSTFAGIAGKQGNINGTGGNPLVPIFNFPVGLAVNSSGNIYVADSGNSLIRMVTPAGVVTTFVGTPSRVGGNDGTTTDPNVTFNLPQGPVVDSSGNLYVADYGGHTIRKISPAGVVTTLAGTAGTSGSTDGTGSAARFFNPCGLAVDSAGNLYVADSGNQVIRKITGAGVVTTLAGTAGTSGSTDGKGTAARFSNPRGIVSDGSGNLYVADTGNNTIRKVTTDGTVSLFAGTVGTFGSADGSGTAARFNFPNALAMDSAGNVYVADQINNTIRKISPAGSVTTLAGKAGTEGRVDGTGTAALFSRPTGVAVDASGNVFVADYHNQLIRKITSAGVVTTVAGAGGFAGLQNGTGYMLDPVLFRNPTSAVVDGSGTVYVADSANNSIRKVSSAGTTSLWVGSSSGLSGTADGNGNNARFNTPSGLALDATGNLFVADSTNHTIRKVTSAGDVSLYAGVLSTTGAVNGDRAVATFESPSGLAVDAGGNVYVADYGNHLIRVISVSGTVSTLAGSAGSPGNTDGVGGSARFSYPRDVVLDGSGNLFIADYGNHVIRKITPGGLVQTLAGSAGNAGSTDGTGSSARFNGPAGLSIDASGNLYVADANNSIVRKVTPAGAVTTIGGTAGSVGTSDGVGAEARFNFPTDVAVDASGNIFVVDNRNHTIRKGSLPGSGGGSGGGGSGGGGSGGGGGGSGGSNGVDDSALGAGFLLQPVGLTSDSLGNYYVCDTANHCIKMITSAGVVSVFAGKSGSSGAVDGTGEAARFNTPTGITIDTSGSLVVTDTGNSTIRKISSAGAVTTFAGTAGTSGTTDGTGTAALFSMPSGIVVNSSTGDLFVTDSASSTIRRITSAGVVTTFAGAARTTGDADGMGAAARFNNPTGLSIDQYGYLIVADTFNHTIRSVSTARRAVSVTANGTIGTAGNALVVLTDAGLTGSPITLNVAVAAGDTADVWAPKIATALAANTTIAARYAPTSSGFIITLTYAAGVDDTSVATLSLSTGTASGITAATSVTSDASATVRTIAGSAGISGAYDGNGQFALFNLPQGVSVNSSSGALYISDTGNSCIRRLAGGGTVTTVAGIAGISGKRSGSGDQALFNQPRALISFSNSVIVADTGNSLLRSVLLSNSGTSVATVSLSAPTTSGGGSGGSDGSSGGGGGGAPSLWFLALLGLLGATRHVIRRRR
jgi:MYXO-CTERM domain-containing protein